VDEDHLSEALVKLHRQVHRTIQRVTRDIAKERQFNTAIAAMMELLNNTRAFESLPEKFDPSDAAQTSAFCLLRLLTRSLTLMLSPFAPHLAEELWSTMGYPGLACQQAWPGFDPAFTSEDQVEIAVQVNGKLRSTLSAPKDASREDLEIIAKEDPKVKKWLEGKTLRRTIVVPGRLVNFVVS
jgi:leucyl-tRNA synthetase